MVGRRPPGGLVPPYDLPGDSPQLSYPTTCLALVRVALPAYTSHYGRHSDGTPKEPIESCGYTEVFTR